MAKLLASASTKNELEVELNKYYFSNNWTITKDNKCYNIKTEKYAEKLVVTEKNGRWRLEQL